MARVQRVFFTRCKRLSCRFIDSPAYILPGEGCQRVNLAQDHHILNIVHVLVQVGGLKLAVAVVMGHHSELC